VVHGISSYQRFRYRSTDLSGWHLKLVGIYPRFVTKVYKTRESEDEFDKLTQHPEERILLNSLL
jgi:hypothetical protein